MATCLPFVKVEMGKYLIGTEVRSIQLKGSSCFVRTSEGYMDLQEWLRYYARGECKKLNSLLQNQLIPFKDVVVSMLKKNNARKRVINKYEML